MLTSIRIHLVTHPHTPISTFLFVCSRLEVPLDSPLARRPLKTQTLYSTAPKEPVRSEIFVASSRSESDIGFWGKPGFVLVRNDAAAGFVLEQDECGNQLG